MAKDKDKDSKKEDSMTPEEKLFRVISGNRDFDLDDDTDDSQDDLIESGFLTKLETWINQTRDSFRGGTNEFFKQFGKQVNKQFESLTKKSNVQVHSLSDIVQIKSINRGLMVLVILMTIYLIGDFLFSKVVWNQTLNLSSKNPMLSLSAPSLIRADLNKYMEKVNQRNVFTLQVPTQTAQGVEGEKPTEEATTVAPAPSNYKLVGISWDDQEYVAMIEYDTTKEGASFVRKGDFLGNGVRVEDIREFTVTLSQGGQKWELN